MKEKIVVIVGPTAVGKTSLSIELAKHFDGEVISGDSMQIYKGLDIGTAKASLKEQAGVPHHLINEINPDESYSVSDFQKKARLLIKEITARGKLPIIVGGTGLYIESLLYDVSHGGTGKTDEAFRLEKEKEADEKGNVYLWEELNRLDPAAAEKIHYNNRRRVIRAMEVHHVTGQLFSVFQNEREKKEQLYDAKIIGLNTTRDLLYERIDLRVEQMMNNGLEKEAKKLFKLGLTDTQSSKGIGYKEWFPYFEGMCSKAVVLEMIQLHSRRYAKRQLTWFKNRLRDVDWFNLIEYPNNKELIFEEIKDFLDPSADPT